jgi:hypothetical protein
MSSFEEYNSEIDNNEYVERNKKGIRLSTLNPKIRDKISKFDTSNDGEINIEEAIQGLITLQKQSNNYKKTVYLLVPLIMVMLACILGVNILAINLTKEIKTTSAADNNFLTNKQGEIVSTISYSDNKGFYEWLLEDSNSFIDILNIGSMRLKVDSIYLEDLNETSIVYVSTPNIWFSLCSNGSYKIENVQGEYNMKIRDLIEEQLKHYQDTLLAKSQNKVVEEPVINLMTVFIDRPEPAIVGKGSHIFDTEKTGVKGFVCIKYNRLGHCILRG